ncbi:MAG: DUF4143 domain-containing protein [Candidatus Methanoplasma sp.]|jgi:predicted AAA+ superfamily ATPase|nr:DUF4143 domain-containing protein [Candidatus Methanoplasma sp.]
MNKNIPSSNTRAYHPRIVDDQIRDILGTFGGLLIEGPKWCGKTWTGLHHSGSALFVGDEKSAYMAKLDPFLALDGEHPRLVDEWQDVPALWDAARRDIDLSGTKGRYIFTGSSVPPKGSTHHTGTGRFARLRMRPMSLFETGDSSGTVSLSHIFGGGAIASAKSGMNYRKAVNLICKGGWPDALGMDGERAMKIPREYIQAVRDSDISRADGRRRSKTNTELLLRSLARNSASPVKISVLTEDMRENGSSITPNTVSGYLDALRSIFVAEEQNAWSPMLRSRSRIRTSPKRHFTDPSLAAAALKASPDILARDANTAGFLFESLCYRDLSVYASAVHGEVYHYLDNTGLEVDEIIELRDGRWGAAEVKMGISEFEKGADNLLSLAEKVKDKMGPPSFLMILNATGGLSYTRDDGVSVVPIDLLGP